jgi:hypothetical protein
MNAGTGILLRRKYTRGSRAEQRRTAKFEKVSPFHDGFTGKNTFGNLSRIVSRSRWRLQVRQAPAHAATGRKLAKFCGCMGGIWKSEEV